MPKLPDSIETDFLLEAHIQLEPPEVIGATPLGRRSIHGVTGGTFEGPRLRGVFHPGGGDWLLSLPDGANYLDVRATLETDDGALIYLSYHGVLDGAPEVAIRAASGEDVPPAEYYFRTAPRFETGSEKYAWLNKLICIGTGYFGRQIVGYRIFAVR